MKQHKQLAVALLACFALVSIAQADDGEQISCRVHVVNNTASPSNNLLGHVRSSLKVLSAADVKDISVILQVQHPDVAALEVTLTAAGSAQSDKRVVLKAPAVGVSGGPNMIQTIFSDFAPSPFAASVSEAPYSSVYRPAEPLSKLVDGDSTAAGAGGSQGVWTLTVTDTAASNSRPLKLTGWELWLCGAANGPLFAQNATAFDSSDATAEVSIVKKKVQVPTKADVDVVLKSNKRAAQASQDPANQVIDQVNTFIAKKLATKFDVVKPLLTKVSPKLATALHGGIADSIDGLSQLPGMMGYTKTANGTWDLPTSEAMIKSFLDTLVHCHNDLYWCWKNTGLQGNFAQDFVKTWDEAAKGATSGWAAAQQEWLKVLKEFEEQNPSLGRWGDVLFYSTIGNLYRAAELDAVASVGEAWADTAIRLALYLSPIRFAVNPRAFIVQTLSLVEIVLRTVFNAFQYLTALTDDNNNNDIQAITLFTQSLVDATREAFDLVTLGMRTRAEGIQKQLTASAGGLARNAANVNEKLAEKLGAIDPRLGAIYNTSTEGVNNILRDMADSQQEAVSRYFRSQANKMNLGAKLDETLQLAGKVVVQLSTNAATAVKAAQEELDKVLPGPDLQKVLIDLRKTAEGILSDAQQSLEKLLPIPELQEMDGLLRATIRAILEILNEGADKLDSSEGAKAIQKQLGDLAESLNKASLGVGEVMNGFAKNFPGPALNSTLEGIKQQGSRTITNIERQFKALAKEYPNLDPAIFVNELVQTLDGLTSNTLDLTTAFENLADHNSTKKLGEALPATLQPVSDAVRTATEALPASLPGGGRDAADTIGKLQKDVGHALESFAEHVNAIAKNLPNQPPLKDITDNLNKRTKDLEETSKALNEAVRNMAGAPKEVAEAALDDFNARLEHLLEDLKSQNKRADELARLLAKGPLADIANGLDKALSPITSGVENVIKLLPPRPDIRKVLKQTLEPPVDALSKIIKDASDTALQAAFAANKGLVTSVAGLTDRLTGLLAQGQMQIATLLKGASKAGIQLEELAKGAADNLKGPMESLDTVLAGIAKGISTNLEKTLTGLAPPPQVIEGLVKPLAKGLNDQLDGLLKRLDSADVSKVLDNLAGVVGVLARDTSSALGLTTPTGRHLLADVTPIAELPPTFNATSFRDSTVAALRDAADQFGSAFVAAANGRPGASWSKVLDQYVQGLTVVANQFEKFITALPQGKLLSVILDPVGGDQAISALSNLQKGLKSAAGQQQQGSIIQELSNVLGALSADGTTRSAIQSSVQSAVQELFPGVQAAVDAFRSNLETVTGGN